MNRNQIEELRQRHEKNAQRLFRHALAIQYRQAIEALNAGYSNPQELVTPSPVSEAYRTVHEKSGVAFARKTYQSLSPAKSDDLSGQWVKQILAHMTAFATRRAEAITKTTKRVIGKIVDQARQKGLGIEKTAALLRRHWRKTSLFRSIAIARTEILSASSFGMILGARTASALTGRPVEKRWQSVIDTRTRDKHRRANGQTRPLDQPFNIGGVPMEYPGDPNGGASNTINCRCSLVFRLKKAD
jgi:uncharacterized protein with gpF-like domain